LRWGAIFSQVLLIYLIRVFFDMSIPIQLVTAIILFEIASNLLFYILQKKQNIIPEWLFVAIMFIDAVLLTVLLAKTGGAMNPFSFLYLLHVVIGAMLMRSSFAWLLGLFTILCYASFFIVPGGLFQEKPYGAMKGVVVSGPVCTDPSIVSTSSTGNQINLHLQGMLVAFTITTVFIVFFISRIRKSLDGYYEMVNQLEHEKVKSEKLAALATLAAGAAHEFSTPLSTIAVAAGELLYNSKEYNLPQEVVDDVSLIKKQVAHCKNILDQLSADAGSYRGEPAGTFTSADLIEDLQHEYSAVKNIEKLFTCAPQRLALKGPRQTISRILKGLVKNAVDASRQVKDPIISVHLSSDDKFFICTITDNGAGIEKDCLSQVTEPFFTTKEAGKGMGLGLFLAQSFAERFGGNVQIDSQEGKGTTVTFRLALSHIGG